MKNILKYAVVLLLLFAMVGTASATISNLTIDSESGDSTSFSISFSWDDDGLSGTVQYNVTIKDSSSVAISDFPVTIGENSSNYSGPLPADNYTITVYTEELSDIQTKTFMVSDPVLALPVPEIDSLVSTSNSNETHFDLTWSWTPKDTETLQLYNGTGWDDVTASGVVAGNPSGDTSIVFRTTDGTNYSANESKGPIQPVGFSNSKTADSITWTLSGWTNYVNFTVTGDVNGSVDEGRLTLSDNELKAENLNPSENYTLKVRGTDGTNYSLFNTNSVELEAAVINFVDDAKSDSNREIFNDNNSSNGTKNFNIESGVTSYINITATESVTFNWELKIFKESDWEVVPSGSDYSVSDNASTNSSNFSWKPSETGKYQLNLTMTNDSATPTKEQIFSWEITITEKSTGGRIWQEGMPTTYSWDARSFSGFYYNLDTGEGNESMTIKNIGRSIDRGDLTYQTTTSETDYAYDSWGSYEIVGFMGDKYFAGDKNSSLMKNGNLSKVLVDTDDTIQLRTGQNYALEEGYSITVQQIDINGGKAQIVFSRDGKEVGSFITSEGETASYYKNIGSGNGNNTTFIKTRVKSVFQGSESAIVEVEGIFQISDKLTRLEEGTKIGKMEITSVTNDKIEMENEERISLSQDSEIDLMGKVKLVVADSSILRFAPVMEYTEPGVYEIRGTVSDYGESDYIIYEWNPKNFEGFYYDINDDVESSEKIKINQTLANGSRSIDKGNLEYSSNITTVGYNYSSWGNYSVVGFMGEKYYAGKDGSLLKDGNLSKVLVDTDEKRQMRTGESMILEEGISIKIDQIDTNGNKARLIIEKDGREINSSIVDSGKDYIYEGNNSKIKDTSFIRIRVDSVFQGTESSIVSIGAVFQASLNLTKLDTDTKYGKMKVDSYSSDGIRLSSDEKISLSQDSEAEFMKVGNETMYFKVGDNSTLRFAPVVERTIGSTDPLSVKVSPSTATVGDVVKITLNDRGTTIEGVTVYVNGSKIGTTGSDGTLNYTTDKAGSFRVTGEKSGYVNGTATLTVNENMNVRVSPENIYYGTTGTIKATDSNGSAVSDATVYVSGENMGRTNSTGELNYTFNKTGTITIEVSKNKYNNGTTSVNISQKVAFAYANFEMKPDEPAAKKAVKVSFDVTNNGIESGSHDVSLVLTDSSGNIIDQDDKTVSVDVGETKSVTLSVKAPEEGSYRLTLKETDSNRTVDLPSSISNVSVGPAKFGSTILYIVLAILAIIILAVIGFVAYLFGVKGATKDNYQYVAQEIVDDVKSKFQRK